MESLLPVMVVAVVLVANLVILLLVIRKVLVVAPPNRMAVITGRATRHSDGTVRGYRLVVGNRTVLTPFLEHLSWMELSNLPLNVTMRRVRVRDGDMTVNGTAHVKLAGEPMVHHAVERFLDRPREEMANVARQTLEGTIRQVAARLCVADLNEDAERLTWCSTEEAEHELAKLGLCLDSLQLSVELPRGAPDAKGATELAGSPSLDGGSPPWAGKT